MENQQLLKRFIEAEGMVMIETAGLNLYQLLSVRLYRSTAHIEVLKTRIFTEIIGSYELYGKYFLVNDTYDFKAAAARLVGTNAYLLTPPCRRHGLLETDDSFQQPLYFASTDGANVSLLVNTQEVAEYEEIFNRLEVIPSNVETMDVGGQEDQDDPFDGIALPGPNDDYLDPTEYIRNVCGIYTRSRITIFFIVPGPTLCQTGKAYFESNHPKEVFMVMTKSAMIAKKFCNDLDLKTDYEIFRAWIPLPWGDRDKNVGFWTAKIIIPWLILTAANFEWRGTNVITLCGSTENSLVIKLIRRVWTRIHIEACRDLMSIWANPDSLLCIDCSPNCRHYGKPWHLDLKTFNKVPSRDDAPSNIFGRYDIPMQVCQPSAVDKLVNSRYDFFSNPEVAASAVAKRLVEMRSNRAELKDVIEYVTKVANDTLKAIKYTTYLIIIFDGPNMEAHANSSFQDMMKDKDIIKSIYAGCSMDEDMSRTHFRGNTSVGRILTGHTRIFQLRKQVFTDWMSAASDEAATIQILKSHWSKARRRKQEPTYLLLNVRTEMEIMYSMTVENREDVQRFCRSDAPLFRTTPPAPDEVAGGRDFTGDYFPESEIIMQPGRYKLRTFADVASLYTELQSREPI